MVEGDSSLAMRSLCSASFNSPSEGLVSLGSPYQDIKSYRRELETVVTIFLISTTYWMTMKFTTCVLSMSWFSSVTTLFLILFSSPYTLTSSFIRFYSYDRGVNKHP